MKFISTAPVHTRDSNRTEVNGILKPDAQDVVYAGYNSL